MRIMNRRPPVTSIVLLGLFLLLGAAQAGRAASTPDDLAVFLETQRTNFHLPALAAAVVRANQTIALGATGFRREGSPEKVTVDDKFHIGSCTKSMTATFAAIMVEEGKVRWDESVADRFPALAPSMNPDFRGATLELLCGNRGGAPNSLDAHGLWSSLRRGNTRPPRDQRIELLRSVLTNAPAARHGTTNLYSNAGMSSAGALLDSAAVERREHLTR